MEFFETLQSLCQQTAPTGFEHPAVQAAKHLLSPLMDEVFTDRLGSVIGIRYCGTPGAKKLLLDAHLDEVGLIVTGIDEGFLCFAALGGIDPRILPGREVTILTRPKPLFGVVSCIPPHVQAKGSDDQSIPIQDLRIDIGMNAKEAENCVPIGTPISYRENLFQLQNGQICGKSLDDRACFAVLLRTAELLQGKRQNVDLYLMGSVREETGGAGAVTGTNVIAPDWCVAVDVTFAKTPGLSEDDAPCKLYGGPAIGVGPGMTWTLTEHMTALADERGIPYQFEVMEGNTGTNGWKMQICREGIPTSVVSLPLKYMHSPVETVAVEDMENMAKLLAAFAETIGEEF